MDKQLKKNVVSIAASAVFLLSVTFSGSALAGPGAKGPKASIKVVAWCDVDATVPENAILNVHTLITDKGGEVSAELTETSTTPVEGVGNNRGGEKFQPLTDGTVVGFPSLIGTEESIGINLCEAGMSSATNAANAMISVDIVGGHKTFTAMCGNHDLDGDGYLDVFSDVKIGHLNKCPQN